jgi:hypothetical protein
MWTASLVYGQSSWLQIQVSGFDSRRCHIFWGVVGLERGPLSLVSTTEELFERKNSGSGLGSREYCHWDPSRGSFYPQKLAPTSPTSGGLSIGVVRLRTQATEFFIYVHVYGFRADVFKIILSSFRYSRIYTAAFTPDRS